MKLDMAIEELHRSENHLVKALLTMSDRHKADHEIFYLGRDLAGWSKEHVAGLARVGRDYDLDLSEEAADDSGVLATVRQKGSELAGRRAEPALLLLADLRHLYRDASGTSLDWEILGQAAGRQGPRTPRPDQAVPPADAAAGAVGQREAQGVLRSGPGQLMGLV